METDQHTKPKSAFRKVNDIGVVWVTDEASKLGYYNGNPEWVNLGQGEPETGEMIGAPARIKHFDIDYQDNRYGPINGMLELRQVIADYYNRLYRSDKKSLYKAENVSIVMGGRLALHRIFSILGPIRLGYKSPEYPAYGDMIRTQEGRVIPVAIPSKKENNYAITSTDFSEILKTYQLDAFLFSNPCNPTGHVVMEDELKEFIAISKQQNCTLIIDEVYSHFIYEDEKPAESSVSAAKYIEDVNVDSILLVDALTKSFRYPGWRLAWALGPKDTIEKLGLVGSAIDGGPSLPIQRAALKLFEPKQVDQETKALRKVFSKKKNLAFKSLCKDGMICSEDINGTFYIWADISKLPFPLNNSDSFFREALKQKVIVVPGYLFDILPELHKGDSNFHKYVRFSFGPAEDQLKIGLERITTLIKSYTTK